METSEEETAPNLQLKVRLWFARVASEGKVVVEKKEEKEYILKEALLRFRLGPWKRAFRQIFAARSVPVASGVLRRVRFQ